VCGEIIRVGAIKCRFCGEDLEAFAARRQSGIERTLFDGHPVPLYSIGRWLLTIVTLGIAGLVFWIQSRSTRFEITTQRVRIMRGVLSRTRQDTELYRIDDIGLEEPLGMRLLGHAVLLLRSSDRSTAVVRLYGIPGLAAMADTLRECGLRERERLGVKVWTQA
jgi:membrane protein YdbS with pleckstrin-like domain